MQRLGPWVGDVLGSAGGTVGLHDLGGFSQVKWLYDLSSCILEVSLRILQNVSWTAKEIPKYQYLVPAHCVQALRWPVVLCEAMQLQMSFVRGAANNKREGLGVLELCWGDLVFRGCSLCSTPSELGESMLPALISLAWSPCLISATSSRPLFVPLGMGVKPRISLNQGELFSGRNEVRYI